MFLEVESCFYLVILVSYDGRVETAITSRTRRPSATRVANKNTGSRSCTAHSAPPPVHQLPELDAPPRHDHLDVREQVPEVTRGQRRTRHDHDERFAQLTQAREDSGKLTEGHFGHHALAEVMLEEVDVLVITSNPSSVRWAPDVPSP